MKFGLVIGHGRPGPILASGLALLLALLLRHQARQLESREERAALALRGAGIVVARGAGIRKRLVGGQLDLLVNVKLVLLLLQLLLRLGALLLLQALLVQPLLLHPLALLRRKLGRLLLLLLAAAHAEAVHQAASDLLRLDRLGNTEAGKRRRNDPSTHHDDIPAC